MKIRKALIAVVAAASLAVVPSTAFAGNRSNDDCRDGSKWKDYKYAPQCECEDNRTTQPTMETCLPTGLHRGLSMCAEGSSMVRPTMLGQDQRTDERWGLNEREWCQ